MKTLPVYLFHTGNRLSILTALHKARKAGGSATDERGKALKYSNILLYVVYCNMVIYRFMAKEHLPVKDIPSRNIAVAH